MLCSCVLILSGLVALSSTEAAEPNRNGAPLGDEPVRMLTATDRRVRTTDAQLQRILVDGARRSRTFRALVAAVNRTDVIVYIEPGFLPPSLAGRLLLLPLAGDQRYVRIQIPAAGSADDRIATIAHELQHALEIAASPEVRDQKALAQLYERIGEVRLRAHSYDTVAAQVAGKTVRAELAG